MAIKGYRTSDASKQRQKVLLKLVERTSVDEAIEQLEVMLAEYERRGQNRAADIANEDIRMLESQNLGNAIATQEQPETGLEIVQNQNITQSAELPMLWSLLTGFYQTSKVAAITAYNIVLILKALLVGTYNVADTAYKSATIISLFTLIYLIGTKGLFGASITVINWIVYATAQVSANTPALDIAGGSMKYALSGMIEISRAMRDSVYVTTTDGLPTFTAPLSPLQAQEIAASANLSSEQLANLMNLVKYPAYFLQNANDIGFTENIRDVTYLSSGLRVLRDYIDQMTN